MGLFKKRAADSAEIERLKAEIAGMSARLEAADERLVATDRRLQAADQRLVATDRRLDDVDSVERALGAQVQGIVTRLETPISPPPHAPPPPPAALDPDALTAVRQRLEELASRLEGVDARITAISVELANQIDELSGELDAAGGTTPPTDEVVDELRDAQTRLANEQARYQIAFRQDLAELADRLKRS
jgi:chromosome segregation ATPase